MTIAARLIKEVAELYVEVGLLSWDRVKSFQSLKPDPKFNEVCLDSELAYEEVYKAGLGLRYFSFCLIDHSFFQFSLSENFARLAFFPNPFTKHDDLLDLIEDPLDFDAFDLTELKATAGRAPLRFDYSPSQYDGVRHPAAHLHLGHGELGRLGSRRMLCPLSFGLLIMRLYYPRIWANFAIESDELGLENSLDRLLAKVLARNGEVQPNFFSIAEERMLYLK